MANTKTIKQPRDDLGRFLSPDKDQSHLNFDGDFGNRLGQFLAAAPKGISIISGYRSPARQKQLFDAAVKKYGSVKAARNWVAPPGKSRHNKGIAADLRYATKEAKEWAHKNAAKFGLNFRMRHEPWHIEPSTIKPQNIKDVPGPWGAAVAPLPTPAPRNLSTKAGQIAYAGQARAMAPATPPTPAQAYGQMARSMAGTGLRNIGGAQSYGAPVGAVTRAPIGGGPWYTPSTAPVPTQRPSTMADMVSGMDSPVYGPSKLPGRSVVPTQPNAVGNMLSGMDSPVYGPGQIAPATNSAVPTRPAAPVTTAQGFASTPSMSLPPDRPMPTGPVRPSLASAPTMANLANEYGMMGRTLADQGVKLSGAPIAAETFAPEAAEEAPKQQTVPSPAVDVQAAPKKQSQTIAAAPQLTQQQQNTQALVGNVKNAIVKNAPAIGATLALGPIAGLAVKYGAPMLGKALGGIGQSIFGGTPNPARTTYGYGTQAIGDVLGGAGGAGATAYSRSTPGYSVTNLGNGVIAKTNQYGVTSYTNIGPQGSLFGGPGKSSSGSTSRGSASFGGSSSGRTNPSSKSSRY